MLTKRRTLFWAFTVLDSDYLKYWYLFLLTCIMLIFLRDTRPNSRNEYTVQVLLRFVDWKVFVFVIISVSIAKSYFVIYYNAFFFCRFCLFETSCEQEDHFPSSLCIKVNGKICPLPAVGFTLFTLVLPCSTKCC